MHPKRVVALTMLVTNLSVCNATADEIVQPPPVDACTLLTLDEATKITGRTFRRTRPGRQGDATTCALTGGTERNIDITLSPSASKKDSDDFRKLLIEQGEKLEPVSGVGDEAFYWGNRIEVRVRNQTLVIAYGDLNQPSAKERADVLALAKLSVSKLK